jgi:hypothetical protein
VQQAKAALGLHRVAEGVAQVEQGARAVVTGVLGNDGGLHGDRTRHRGFQRPAVPRQQFWSVPFKRLEEAGVAQQAVLHHLGVAGAHLAVGQGVEHAQVAQNEARLMEGADQVLAARRVDGGLAAH